MDHNAPGRRPHYHRGRRGTERRGGDRRAPQHGAEQGNRGSGEHVDVEQIMREIRARISERHNIDLSPQQIQDLAARRLEAILDPRNINPSLLEQLRKGAGTPPDPLPAVAEVEYTVDDEMIYASPKSGLRFIRRLLNPLLKLLFNPLPLIEALRTQTRINRDAAARAAEAARRQAEWNALHYQILQRLVTEVSRSSLELQAFNNRIESLSARVDFNDRRVRSIESTAVSSRGQRAPEPAAPPSVPAATEAVQSDASPPATASGSGVEATRRRRRRRRGRRGTAPAAEAGAMSAGAADLPATGDLESEADEGDEADVAETEEIQAEASSSPVPDVPAAFGVEREPAVLESAPAPQEPAAAPVESAPAPDSPASAEAPADANPRLPEP